jgi:DNA modification methylase
VNNILYCGDNLEVLKKEIKDESIDLIYIDPSFFSNKQYEVVWGDKAEIRSFEDRY